VRFAPPALFLVIATGCGGKGDVVGDTDPGVVPDTDPVEDSDPADTDDTDEPEDTDPPPDADRDGTPDAQDCDDADPERHPGAEERCDGEDDDCDGQTDEDATDALAWHPDADGDGFGDPDVLVAACEAPEAHLSDASDCDDAAAGVHPGADEICNATDDDCDGDTDEDASDATWSYEDADGDGFGGPTAVRGCEAPAGYVGSDDDCDDGSAAVHPGAAESCDGVDEDCDGTTDEDATDGGWFYEDADGDGFGGGPPAWACDGVEQGWDCDDADPVEPVVVDGAAGDTIQGGIDAANGCVVVYAGTYVEDVDFGGKDLVVTGVDGADVTVLEGAGTGPVVTFDDGESAAAVLDGFTVTGGAGRLEKASSSYACGDGTWDERPCVNYYEIYCGGGILADAADPTLRNLVVEANLLPEQDAYTYDHDTYYTYSYGGGLCLIDSGSAITGVEVRGNDAGVGGGLYVGTSYTGSASVSVSRSWIVGNTAVEGGGVRVEGGLALENVVSAGNTASETGGGAHVVQATLDATNVTWGDDDAPIGGGIYVDDGAVANVTNGIVYGAATGEGVYVESSGAWSGAWTDVYGNAGGGYSGIADPTGTAGNLAVDPMFSAAGDWRLDAASPLVDAGDPDPARADPDGSINDLGAYGGPGGDW
jgi:hypothetical protein